MTTNQSSVEPGEPVGIVATVANAGNTSESFALELTLFGEVVDARDVEVPAGETRAVTFVREIQAPGEYAATIENASATIVVENEASNDADGNTADSPDFVDEVDTSIRAPLGTLLPLVAVLAALALAARNRS